MVESVLLLSQQQRPAPLTYTLAYILLVVAFSHKNPELSQVSSGILDRDISVVGQIRCTQSSVACEEEIECCKDLEKAKVGVIKDSAAKMGMLLAALLALKDIFVLDALSLYEIVLITCASVTYESFRELD